MLTLVAGCIPSIQNATYASFLLCYICNLQEPYYVKNGLGDEDTTIIYLNTRCVLKEFSRKNPSLVRHLYRDVFSMTPHCNKMQGIILLVAPLFIFLRNVPWFSSTRIEGSTSSTEDSITSPPLSLALGHCRFSHLHPAQDQKGFKRGSKLCKTEKWPFNIFQLPFKTASYNQI